MHRIRMLLCIAVLAACGDQLREPSEPPLSAAPSPAVTLSSRIIIDDLNERVLLGIDDAAAVRAIRTHLTAVLHALDAGDRAAAVAATKAAHAALAVNAGPDAGDLADRDVAKTALTQLEEILN